MKRILFLVCQILLISLQAPAQKYEPVTVRAGVRIMDCFPFNERYRYPEFVTGRMYLKNGVYSEAMVNYNFLNGEMEYIRKKDTLAIANKKDIRYISVSLDTFYFDRGFYLEQIGDGAFKVVLKQYIKLLETQKKDSYGTSSSGSASNSYGSLPLGGNFYKLTANEDLVFQKTLEYYLSLPSGGFVQFTRKNVFQHFSQHEDVIKTYLKSNKVNFESRDDLIRFAGYLEGL